MKPSDEVPKLTVGGELDIRFDGPDITTLAYGTPPLTMTIRQPEPRQLRIPPRVMEIAKAHTPEGPGYISDSELVYAMLEYLCELEERKP
jgi:hypothetical protein